MSKCRLQFQKTEFGYFILFLRASIDFSAVIKFFNPLNTKREAVKEKKNLNSAANGFYFSLYGVCWVTFGTISREPGLDNNIVTHIHSEKQNSFKKLVVPEFAKG